MQFQPSPIREMLSGATPTPAVAEPGAPAAAAASSARPARVEAAQNLLKHIPGEASGFYLMAVDTLTNPSLGILLAIFVCALVLLVLVRWLAGASIAITLTTVGAFVIWMAVLDKGLLQAAFPTLLPDPFGLLLAIFYSTVITLLAGAGKLR